MFGGIEYMSTALQPVVLQCCSTTEYGKSTELLKLLQSFISLFKMCLLHCCYVHPTTKRNYPKNHAVRSPIVDEDTPTVVKG